MAERLDPHERDIRRACRKLDHAVEARRRAEDELDAVIARKRAALQEKQDG